MNSKLERQLKDMKEKEKYIINELAAELSFDSFCKMIPRALTMQFGVSLLEFINYEFIFFTLFCLDFF